MKLFRGRLGLGAVPDSGVRLVSKPAELDGGPVVILVDERGTDEDTLDWAAAEAAERGSELRIVYAFRWPRVPDPLGNMTVDVRAREGAKAVVSAAVRRSHRMAPSLRITTTAYPGRPVAALVAEARRTDRALVVLGRNRGFERALARRLVRRTTASLAVISLSPRASVGPSAGRVVVGVDVDGKPLVPAMSFAFRAARRRGIGLTVVHAGRSTAGLEDAARSWLTAYPEVDVRWVVAAGPIDSSVLAESAAAALTVLGADRHRWLPRVERRSTPYDVLRLARGPVVVVGTHAV
jgi:nucleotide-binding universal stress UspA family protein